MLAHLARGPKGWNKSHHTAVLPLQRRLASVHEFGEHGGVNASIEVSTTFTGTAPHAHNAMHTMTCTLMHAPRAHASTCTLHGTRCRLSPILGLSFAPLTMHRYMGV